MLIKKKNTDDELKKIINEQKKFINYLRNCFKNIDCEDVFLSSIEILCNKVKSGKVNQESGSLEKLLYGICRNKALEMSRKGRDSIVSFDENERILNGGKVNALIAMDKDNTESKDEIVRRIVASLPSPCKEIFYSLFWNGVSLKELAPELGYTYGTIRVKSAECNKKFRNRYQEELNKN